MTKTIRVKGCPIRKSLKIIGGKWALIILFSLQKAKRYGELKKEIPDISEKMLIQTLRLLEDNKFIQRKDYKKIPPKVEYSLLKNGKDSLKVVDALIGIGLGMK